MRRGIKHGCSWIQRQTYIHHWGTETRAHWTQSYFSQLLWHCLRRYTTSSQIWYGSVLLFCEVAKNFSIWSDLRGFILQGLKLLDDLVVPLVTNPLISATRRYHSHAVMPPNMYSSIQFILLRSHIQSSLSHF